MVSVEVKESLIPSYSIAESLIKEFHLTRGQARIKSMQR